MKLIKNKLKWWYMIIIGFANIFDGLVIILTLGIYSSNATLILSMWYGMRNKYKKGRLKPK